MIAIVAIAIAAVIAAVIGWYRWRLRRLQRELDETIAVLARTSDVLDFMLDHAEAGIVPRITRLRRETVRPS